MSHIRASMRPLLVRSAMLAVLAWPLAAPPAGAQLLLPDKPAGQPAGVPSAEQLKQKRAELEAAIRAHPEEPENYIVLAAFWTANRDLAGALKVLEQGIAFVPKSIDLRIVQARLLLLKGQPDDAIAAYQAAIGIDAGNVTARVELGDLLRTRQHKPEDALAQYDAALAAAPDDVGALAGRGQTLLGLGRLDEALTTLAKAAGEKPQRPPVLLMYAEALLRAGKPADALAAIDAALKLEPSYVDGHVARGNVLRETGKPEEARQEFNLALREDKRSVAAMSGIGLTYAAEGQIDPARTYLSEVLRLDPNNIYALNAMAWMAAERKEDLGNALGWAFRAAQLAPGQPDVLDTLGWVLRQKGEPDKAVEFLARSASLRPSAETLTHLGLAQADGGHKDEARKSFEAALQLSPDDAAAKDGLRRVQ
jgi:tetratricopeptide (TPR) repeat protein